MLQTYRTKNWDDSEQQIADLRVTAKSAGIDLDVLYDLYEERIEEYRKNPPPTEWDGVFVATSK